MVCRSQPTPELQADRNNTWQDTLEAGQLMHQSFTATVRLTALAFAIGALSDVVLADEVIVRSLNLPGTSLEQEVTYHPTRADYERVRDATLQRLRAGDPTASVNPVDGPWLRAETTARIGIEIRGVGVSEGRINYRQISAAEEALYILEH